MGIDPTNPTIKRPEAAQPAPTEPTAPAMPGQPMPAANPAAQPADIASLLGGGQ